MVLVLNILGKASPLRRTVSKYGQRGMVPGQSPDGELEKEAEERMDRRESSLFSIP